MSQFYTSVSGRTARDSFVAAWDAFLAIDDRASRLPEPRVGYFFWEPLGQRTRACVIEPLGQWTNGSGAGEPVGQ